MPIQSIYRWLQRSLHFNDWELGREIEIRTDRLLLREFREEDGPSLFEYRSDPEVRRYDIHRPSTEAEVRARVKASIRMRRRKPRTVYDLVIGLEPEGRVIGEISLIFTGWGRTASLGFMLHRRFWNQGYTSEAASEMVRFGFAELELSRIVSQCHPDNVGSWRVMEKAGLKRQNHRPRIWFQDGSTVSSLEYALSRNEWEEAHRVHTGGEP